MADEDAIIPATVTGRDNINNVRPQNFVVGATKTLRPNSGERSRALRSTASARSTVCRNWIST